MHILANFFHTRKSINGIIRPSRGSSRVAAFISPGAVIEIKRAVTLFADSRQHNFQPAQVTKRIFLLVSWAGFRFFWSKKDELKSIDVPTKSFEGLKKGTPILAQFSLGSLSVENTW
jgi:hypothetical protein